jgi:hypothetical protein
MNPTTGAEPVRAKMHAPLWDTGSEGLPRPLQVKSGPGHLSFLCPQCGLNRTQRRQRRQVRLVPQADITLERGRAVGPREMVAREH